MKQKIYNTLYGAIVADALGVPVEFKDRDYLKNNPLTESRASVVVVNGFPTINKF